MLSPVASLYIAEAIALPEHKAEQKLLKKLKKQAKSRSSSNASTNSGRSRTTSFALNASVGFSVYN